MEMADALCRQPNIVELASDFCLVYAAVRERCSLSFVVECAEVK